MPALGPSSTTIRAPDTPVVSVGGVSVTTPLSANAADSGAKGADCSEPLHRAPRIEPKATINAGRIALIGYVNSMFHVDGDIVRLPNLGPLHGYAHSRSVRLRWRQSGVAGVTVSSNPFNVHDLAESTGGLRRSRPEPDVHSCGRNLFGGGRLP